jgi:hypothetical protein
LAFSQAELVNPDVRKVYGHINKVYEHAKLVNWNNFLAHSQAELVNSRVSKVYREAEDKLPVV